MTAPVPPDPVPCGKGSEHRFQPHPSQQSVCRRERRYRVVRLAMDHRGIDPMFSMCHRFALSDEQTLRVEVPDLLLLIHIDGHLIKEFPSGFHVAVWIVRGEQNTVDT